MNTKLKQRIIEVMTWIVEDMKHRFDSENGNFDVYSQGNYSPELTEAIEALEELKQE